MWLLALLAIGIAAEVMFKAPSVPEWRDKRHRPRREQGSNLMDAVWILVAVGLLLCFAGCQRVFGGF